MCRTKKLLEELKSFQKDMKTEPKVKATAGRDLERTLSALISSILVLLMQNMEQTVERVCVENRDMTSRMLVDVLRRLQNQVEQEEDEEDEEDEDEDEASGDEGAGMTQSLMDPTARGKKSKKNGNGKTQARMQTEGCKRGRKRTSKVEEEEGKTPAKRTRRNNKKKGDGGSKAPPSPPSIPPPSSTLPLQSPNNPMLPLQSPNNPMMPPQAPPPQPGPSAPAALDRLDLHNSLMPFSLSNPSMDYGEF